MNYLFSLMMCGDIDDLCAVSTSFGIALEIKRGDWNVRHGFTNAELAAATDLESMISVAMEQKLAVLLQQPKEKTR